MFAGLFTQFGGWIAAAIAVAVSLFTAYRSGHSAGKSQANAENAQANADIQVAAAQKREEVANATVTQAQKTSVEVDALPSGAAADELRNEFSRTDTGSKV